MFGLVAKYKKAIMIGFFVLIVPPFALFGMDQYFREGGRAQTLATVGGYEITEQEFALALRERQEMLRNLSRGKVDPALLESNEQRFEVLDTIVQRRVLIDRAVRSGLNVTADQLRAYIAQVPAFQENGQFSSERYQEYLRARERTPAMFENQLRHDLLISQLHEAYAETSFTPRTVAERLLRLSGQQREVSRALVSPEKFASSVKLDEGAAKKHYDASPAEFRIPEQVRVEYVTLSAESMVASMQVDPNDVKKFYDQNPRQFGAPESRQASHILIAVDRSAPDAEKQKARALAAQVAAEAQKNPARFAELAKKHSQDPGSAAKGGDLGSFSRGSGMVKPFEDAVFSMKAGEVSEPVETEYGYHVIRLAEVTPAQVRGFGEVRAEIERELKKSGAAATYAKTANDFNNIVFEQSDSLKPAADLLKQTTQKSGWITRKGAEDARLANPRLVEAIFSDDVLNGKRNTEAIEVAPGTIIAARIAEHKPAAMRPFEEVRSEIEKKLVATRASQLAAQEGREKLEAARQGKDPQVSWSAPALVSRTEPKGYDEALLRQAFKADAEKLPSYSGVEVPGGDYVLLRVSKVVDQSTVDKAQQKELGEGLSQMLGQEQFTAYVASLKQKTKVRVNKERVERK